MRKTVYCIIQLSEVVKNPVVKEVKPNAMRKEKRGNRKEEIGMRK